MVLPSSQQDLCPSVTIKLETPTAYGNRKGRVQLGEREIVARGLCIDHGGGKNKPA